MRYIKLFEYWNKSINSDVLETEYEINEKIVTKIAKSLGEEVELFLGQGSYGLAFRLKSGKVLKITKDENEARAVSNLKDRGKLKHIINYHDIRKYKDMYIIIMDYIEPLSGDYRKVYELIQVEYSKPKKYSNEYIYDTFSDNLDEKEKEVLKNILKQRESFVSELKEHNLNLMEAYVDNVGLSENGNLIHFDVWMKRAEMRKLNKEIII